MHHAIQKWTAATGDSRSIQIKSVNSTDRVNTINDIFSRHRTKNTSSHRDSMHKHSSNCINNVDICTQTSRVAASVHLTARLRAVGFSTRSIVCPSAVTSTPSPVSNTRAHLSNSAMPYDDEAHVDDNTLINESREHLDSHAHAQTYSHSSQPHAQSQFLSIRAFHLGRTIDFRRMSLEYSHIPQALQRDSLILDLSSRTSLEQASGHGLGQFEPSKRHRGRGNMSKIDNNISNINTNSNSSNNDDVNEGHMMMKHIISTPSYAVIYRYGSIVFFNVSDTVRDEIEDNLSHEKDELRKTDGNNRSKTPVRSSRESQSKSRNLSLQAECIRRTKAFVSSVKFPHCTEDYGVIVTSSSKANEMSDAGKRATSGDTNATENNGGVHWMGHHATASISSSPEISEGGRMMVINDALHRDNNNNTNSKSQVLDFSHNSRTPVSPASTSKINYSSTTLPTPIAAVTPMPAPTSTPSNTFISGDHVVVESFDLNSVRVIGSVLGQSVALDHYAHEADAMLRIFTKLNEEMEKSGTFSMKKERLFQLVATNNTTLTDLVNNLKLLDRSETAWKYKMYSDLWEELRTEFELEERFETLEYKLNLVQHNVKFFLEILQNRKSDTLEWIIIILISGEIGVSLYDIATRL